MFLQSTIEEISKKHRRNTEEMTWLAGLVLQQQAYGQAWQQHLAGGGGFAYAIEAVAYIETYDVVGKTGNDAEVDLVGIDGVGIFELRLRTDGRCSKGSGNLATDGVLAVAQAAVHAEVPVQAVAGKAEWYEAHTLEELKVEFGEVETAFGNFLVAVDACLRDTE